MNFSIIGGGAWGTTIGQLLVDNGHDVCVYDIKPSHVDKINQHKHPFFDTELPKNLKATSSLDEVIAFSDHYVLSVPTKAMRIVLKQMNEKLTKPSTFINISKGIEPKTLKRVSEIVDEEIDDNKKKGYVVLTGPSHAEEVILRKLTLLVTASNDQKLAKEMQHIFSNDAYLRVYTSSDMIGSEIGGAVKNAIAVISGACTGMGMGENARAAVITRGILEIVKVVEIMGGDKNTAFGLTGIGDLIVTASSENSRNFTAGKKLGQGMKVAQIYEEQQQTIEGFRTIEALHDLALKNNIELPMIETAYEIIHETLTMDQAIKKILSRDLKSEDF